MATEYCRSMLRICIAQLCQNLGWSATQSTPLELLTDVLERYLMDLGKISHRYSEQFGRTEPNLDDLALTFRQYGIQLGELEDYIRHVEPVAFARDVVSFPSQKCNNLGFPNTRSRELLQRREEHVDGHLPYMFPGMEDEVEEEPPRPSLPTPQLPQESVSPMTVSPTPSDKRPLSSSTETGPASKRPRMTSSNLPEEAGHSQYEMKSLLVNTSGVLTPTRHGKLPDARTPPTFRQALLFDKDTSNNKNRAVVSQDQQIDITNNSVPPKKKMLKQYKGDGAAKISKRSVQVDSPHKSRSPKIKAKGKCKESSDKGDDSLGESCLKDLLLSPKGLLKPSKHKGKKSKDKDEICERIPRLEPGAHVRASDSESGAGDENSRDNSPERLIIAENEARIKYTKEERQALLARIDETLDCVVRESVAEMERKEDELNVQKKDARHLDKQKRSDISDDSEMSIPRVKLSAVDPLFELSQNPGKKEKKEKKKGAKKKDKGGSAKEKLKDKLKFKEQLSDLVKKPSPLDKFSGKEFSVYDFPESPPSLSLLSKKSGSKSSPPKQVAHPPPMLTPELPAYTPAPPQPTATSPAVEAPITSDLSPLIPFFIDLKNKDKKDKERSKDKEHKKEKKEKKKDKEKKKKNKDKSKDKSRDKSRPDRHKEESDIGNIVAPIKLNIKFGGSSAATSTVITEAKMKSPKQEVMPILSPTRTELKPLLSPKREFPKLVIKPIRRESLEAKAKLGAAGRSPAPPPLSPPPPSPPRVEPKLKSPPVSPISRTPPRSPTPPPKIATPPKSPPPLSPPVSIHDSPPPKSPTPSPLPPSPLPPRSPTPPPKSPTPPPRSPTPEKLRTPSPELKHRTPNVSPVRKSVIPESVVSSRKSPTPVEQSPPPRSPSPSLKSTPPSSPGSPRLEMDIDNNADYKNEDVKDQKPKSKPVPKLKAKQSPKGTKPSPKGKRGRKPKEKPDVGKGVGAVKARTKTVPSVTSETVSQTPITGPIVQRTVVAETVGSFIDAEGTKVWICPTCKMQDDGSPMIGCDTCDDWYHWVCMSITQEPDEEDWYCPRCQEMRSKNLKGNKKKKRGRKKKT